jgi:hypothetical protein
MSAQSLRLIGMRPCPAPRRGAQMFMDRPLVQRDRVIWPWRLTNEQKRAVRPLREFFDGSQLDRVLEEQTVRANKR